jgi:hypothetical protein
MPWALPGATMHEVPGQQSALLVQALHAAWHAVPLQMNAGVPPSAGFGTQFAPLQQLALDAHAAPVAAHVPGAQRGTPTLSCLQVSIVWQLPAQQSQEELQLIVLSLQTSPSGLQPMGRRQTPTVFGAVMEHTTAMPDPPG